MVSFKSFENLKSIGGDLRIENNELLQTIDGFRNIETIKGYLVIRQNPILIEFDGFSKLKSLGEGLYFADNTSLENCSGLDSLASIGSIFYLSNHTNLENLNAFQSLKSVGGSISLLNLGKIESLSGLDSIDYQSIDTLFIQSCPKLSECNVWSVCMHLATSELSFIENNTIGCNSPNEIFEICKVTSVGLIEPDQVVIYPNPSKGIILVSGIESAVMTISDAMGKNIMKQSIYGTTEIDLSNQAVGTYYITLTTKNQVFTKMIVKE